MHTPRKSGFTLVELLIVLAILSLLMALLYPVFAHARQKARQTTCASNLRQIGLAAMQYSGDNDGLMFHTRNHADDSGLVTEWSFCWNPLAAPGITVDAACGPLAPFLKNANVWYCPSSSGVKAADYFNPVPPPYGLNFAFRLLEHDQGRPVSLAQVQTPAETILAADSAGYSSFYPGSPFWSEYVYLPSDHTPTVHRRHSGMANVLWLDGHVSARRPVSPDATTQALNIGDILKAPYTGNAATDDFYYELVKP